MNSYSKIQRSMSLIENKSRGKAANQVVRNNIKHGDSQLETTLYIVKSSFSELEK